MPVFALAPASIHRLRRRLDASGEGVASAILQDAGFATGEALHNRWKNRVAERTGLDDAGNLDVRWFGPMLDELFTDLGWGSVSVTMVGDTALLLEAGAWAESEAGATTLPSCHFSCGCFASFLTAQAGSSIAVLEVECRSRGDDACRFLAASAATLGEVYDLLAAGRSWRDAYPMSE